MRDHLTLLTIEDEEFVRRSIRAFFEDSGFHVLEAGDGDSGLSLFREKRPDLVLVDLRMPGISGLEVIDTLAHEAPETPVVVLSGTGVVADAMEAIRKGAWDFVTKPITDMTELEHVVKGAMERARLREENRRYREHLEEEVARRTQELRELYERLKAVVLSTRNITACVSTEDLECQLLEEFALHMGAGGGSLYLLEDRKLVLKHTLDPGHAPTSISLPLPSDSVFGKALETKMPILIHDIMTEKSALPSGWTGYANGSVMTFPLFDAEGTVLGLVTLHNKTTPPFTDQDHEIGAILASYACEAIKAVRATDLLRESEVRYRELVENMNDAVYMVNADGKVDYVSPVMETITGYTRSELLGTHLKSLFPARQVPQMERAIQRLLSGEPASNEYTLRKKSGELIWVRTSSRPIWKLGRIVGFQGILMDMTERKIAERHLETSAGELALLNSLGKEIGADLSVQSATKTAMDYIFRAIDSDLSILFLKEGSSLLLKCIAPEDDRSSEEDVPVHRVGECLCGLAVESGQGVYSIDIHSDPRCTFSECKEAGFCSFAALPLSSGGHVLGVLGVASRTERDFEEQATFLEALSNEIAIGLRNAILYEKAQADASELQNRLMRIQESENEKRALSEQLQQAQKMEAIGTLAGGIAHDFNNILMPIIMGSEMALMRVPIENEAYPLIQKILDAGVRAKDLVQQILTFSRQTDLEKRKLKLLPILKETLKLARAALPSTIEIRQDIHAENDMILANPTQVHQVMMNLFANAGHAMRENGGILEITVHEKYLDTSATADVPGLTAGNFLKMTVRDTGLGMDQRTMERVFDPFFTTKERGDGTGLGLSIVHGIVTSTGGAIQVESRVGEGSSFTLYFPVTKAAKQMDREEEKPIPKGTEKILLVDDEPVVAEIYGELLGHLGYTVEISTSPLDALETFKEDPRAFDLLITDMTMPSLTGDKLAVEVMRIRPDMPVILCTGFSERISEDEAHDLGIGAFIEKPMVVADVAEKIRRVLENKKMRH
ncbi:MAG: response regulator [Deltaproteobacteria bacterium]|nr:response regulator [Deltaproteobacteria bacterium]